MSSGGPYDSISSMEPLLPGKDMGRLKESAADLMRKASSLNSMLNPHTASAIKELLRSMNSYYSNLIEGQSTHPAKIEDALNKALRE
ncbi:MAG: hypothetical protein HC902_07105 [Calothrix sp. SM1_5_4]|nr:hypothetical protein [Calothrix sp. SM1_5_4]